MKNNEKIKKLYNQKLSLLNDNIHIENMNHSFQAGNNKLKLKYSFLEKEKVNLNNFRKKILSKISQLQINQQKTNLKLSSLISILLSKLLGNQNFTIFHSHFSILKINKVDNFTKNNNDNDNEIQKFIESHMNKESNQDKKEKEKEINNKNNIRKIGTISLETELEIRRYTLSNQKTKTKEQYFKNKEKNKNKNSNEKNDINFYNNLFKIDINNENNNIIENARNNYYYNSLNKNSSSENLKISKNIYGNSSNNNRKAIAFNEMNQNNISKNNYAGGGKNEVNKIVFSENNENRRVYINALNIHSNSHTINNISESKSAKGPVKIKLNKTEKPVLLINLNENNSNKSNNSGNYKNILDISDNCNDKKLSLQIEDSTANISKNKITEKDFNNDDIKIRRKYSESKSESEINFPQFIDNKQKNVYSRKIRGFNFRNNIKKNKEETLIDEYVKIKGGSVRYDNNGRDFSQFNSLEN